MNPRTEVSTMVSKCVGSCARQSERNRNEYLADAPLALPVALLALAAGRYQQATK